MVNQQKKGSSRGCVRAALQALWYAPHTLPYSYQWLHFLKLFSCLYHRIMVLRAGAYRRGLCRRFCAGVPVVVVGNLTVGGTGKTPLIVSLFRALTAQGYTPGIISRGYKGQYTQAAVCVTAMSSPAQVGDEAVMLANQLGGPICVGRQRALAADYLLQCYPQCDVILSDDGLQHYRLARQMEIVVVDAKRQWGNGYTLPGGPLREPISRLTYAQCLVFMHTACTASETEKRVAGAHGVSCPRYHAYVRLAYIEHLLSGRRLDAFTALPTLQVHAVAGIGQPDKFFRWLTQHGLQVRPHPFQDHHAFCAQDIDWGGEEAVVLMTQKDAVKCRPWIDQRHWQVVIDVRISPQLLACIMDKITVK